MALLYWYPFNGNCNNKGVAADATITKTAIVFQGVGRGTQAIKMPDSSFTIKCPQLAGKRVFSLSVWAYKSTEEGGYTPNQNHIPFIYLKDKHSNGIEGAGLRLCSSYGDLANERSFSLHNSLAGTNDYTLSSSNIIKGSFYVPNKTNYWTHLVITSSGEYLKFYVDGVLIAQSVQAQDGSLDDEGTIYINSVIATNYKGYINDLRIYNHVLSTKEIVELAHGLIVHYPMSLDAAGENKVLDGSGYDNDGIFQSSDAPTYSSDSPLNSGSFDFNGNKKIKIDLPYGINYYTISWWAKSENYNNTLMWRNVSSDFYGFYNGNSEIYSQNASINGYELNGITMLQPTTNAWHHFVIIGDRDNNNNRVYIDGELKGNGTYHSFQNENCSIVINGDNSDIYNYNGKMADFRVYSTVLSDEAIKTLYHARVAVDNYQNIYFHELNESVQNLALNCNIALLTNTINSFGVYAYQQKNCRCSIDGNQYHIIRDPNLTYSDNDNSTKTMHGGLILRLNENNICVEKGHTYLLMFHIKGYSSVKLSNVRWAISAGWNRDDSGLVPRPTNISSFLPTANFNGEIEAWYKWTVSDEPYKIASIDWNNYKQGQTYYSYKEFILGFSYGNTGANGTNLSIDNIRMYDITNLDLKQNFSKKGVLNGLSINESNKAQVARYSITGKSLTEL